MCSIVFNLKRLGIFVKNVSLVFNFVLSECDILYETSPIH